VSRRSDAEVVAAAAAVVVVVPGRLAEVDAVEEVVEGRGFDPGRCEVALADPLPRRSPPSGWRSSTRIYVPSSSLIGMVDGLQ